MASIEKRTSKDEKITYRVKVRLKGFPIQTASFERLTDARRWAQQTEAAIREGRHFKTSEAKRHTLSDAINRYVETILPLKKSQNDQRLQLQWWNETIGCYSLADINAPLIAQQRDILAKGVTHLNKERTPATVNRYMAVLSHLFSVAAREWGWVNENPLQKVRKLKEPRGRIRFLSNDEREALLAACKESESEYLYLVVILALATGARKMEILSLHWKDVDLDRGVITLHQTKNGDRRILPLVGHAHHLMSGHAKMRHLHTSLVFPGSDPKKPIDIRTPWLTALKRAEVNDFKYHDLRHSCASYLAMNGATLAEIAEILGHKTLQMVKRYAHLSEAHTSEVVARMNEKIFNKHN